MPENLTDSHVIPRTSARYYLITILGTILLLLSIIPLAILSLADLGPTTQSTENVRYIYFFGKQKQKIADQTQGHRLILLGGSGAFYSVRAKALQSQFGIPVINNALHAGLNIKYLLHRARQSLRPGDTALLFIEYFLYSRYEPEWVQADYFLPHDLPYFATQPLDTEIVLISKLTPNEYGNRIYDAIFGQPIEGKEILARLNDRGDLIDNQRASQKDFHKAALDRLLPMNNKKMFLRKENMDVIADFIHWCQRNRISVIVGYPAFMDFPAYHSGIKEPAFFQSLESYYHSLGIPTLGKPSDFMFPKSMFFDTNYHLHDEGAAVMTDLVAQRLEPILGITRKPRSITSNEDQQSDTPISQPLRLIFSEKNIPAEIRSLTGFSEAEAWGRWTDGRKASIELAHSLPLHFRLDVHVAHVFNNNSKTAVIVRVGAEEHSVLVAAPNTMVSMEFQTNTKGKVIEIIPPQPQSPKQLGLSDDPRMLGLGFSRLKITPLNTGTAKISAQ